MWQGEETLWSNFKKWTLENFFSPEIFIIQTNDLILIICSDKLFQKVKAERWFNKSLIVWYITIAHNSSLTVIQLITHWLFPKWFT